MKFSPSNLPVMRSVARSVDIPLLAMIVMIGLPLLSYCIMAADG